MLLFFSVGSIRMERGKLVGSESVGCSVSDPSDSENDVDKKFGLVCFFFTQLAAFLEVHQ